MGLQARRDRRVRADKKRLIGAQGADRLAHVEPVRTMVLRAAAERTDIRA